jgi:hypothetical protein
MRIRLGAGDISASGPNPAAQICFLEAVALCVPQALDDLASRDATDASQLQAWARQWGFADDWLRRHARTHVRLWRAASPMIDVITSSPAAVRQNRSPIHFAMIRGTVTSAPDDTPQLR